MYIGIPQFLMVAIVIIELSVHNAHDGEPINRNYCFWHQLINWGVILFLLYWGGFFKP